MCKNITNEIRQNIKISVGELTEFYYKDTEYGNNYYLYNGRYDDFNKKLKLNEEINLIPVFDSEECEFSIQPSIIYYFIMVILINRFTCRYRVG